MRNISVDVLDEVRGITVHDDNANRVLDAGDRVNYSRVVTETDVRSPENFILFLRSITGFRVRSHPLANVVMRFADPSKFREVLSAAAGVDLRERQLFSALEEGNADTNDIARYLSALGEFEQESPYSGLHPSLQVLFAFLLPRTQGRSPDAQKDMATVYAVKESSVPSGKNNIATKQAPISSKAKANKQGGQPQSAPNAAPQPAPNKSAEAEREQKGVQSRASAEAAGRPSQEADQPAREESARRGREEAAERTREEAARRGREEAAERTREEAARRGREEAAERTREEAARRGREEAGKRRHHR